MIEKDLRQLEKVWEEKMELKKKVEKLEEEIRRIEEMQKLIPIVFHDEIKACKK